MSLISTFLSPRLLKVETKFLEQMWVCSKTDQKAELLLGPDSISSGPGIRLL